MNSSLNISKSILKKYLNMIGGAANQQNPSLVTLKITVPFCEVEVDSVLDSLQLIIHTDENITISEIKRIIREEISRRSGNNPFCNYIGHFYIYYTGTQSPNVQRNYILFNFTTGTLKNFIEEQLNLNIDHESPIQLTALSTPPSYSPAPAGWEEFTIPPAAPAAAPAAAPVAPPAAPPVAAPVQDNPVLFSNAELQQRRERNRQMQQLMRERRRQTHRTMGL